MSYSFATSPVQVTAISGAGSYVVTGLGIILRFPKQTDLTGSFTFGIYADGGNKPTGPPLVATTVSSIRYAPGMISRDCRLARLFSS